VIVIGLTGILLSIACYWVVFPRSDQCDPWLFALILIMHLGMTLLYWQYSLSNAADSRLYYYDWLGFANQEIKAGTIFLIKTISFMISLSGGSYLDFFLLFQAFGVAGICIILRVFMEIHEDLGQSLDRTTKLIFLLPGLHFWTSAIGKDAPLFFAVALSVLAMLNIERRHWMFAVALIVMLPLRPHIAAIAVIALIATLMLDRRVRASVRLPLLAMAAIGATWIFATAQQTLSINEISPESIDEFFARRQDYGMSTGEEGASIVSLPLPLKIASLLFRPLFLDARGLFGLVVSFENLIIIGIFATIFFRIKEASTLFNSLPFFRYSCIFSGITVVLLSLVTYNVGLGLRQKFMTMPAVLVIFVSLIAYRRAVASMRAAVGSAPGQLSSPL